MSETPTGTTLSETDRKAVRLRRYIDLVVEDKLSFTSPQSGCGGYLVDRHAHSVRSIFAAQDEISLYHEARPERRAQEVKSVGFVLQRPTCISVACCSSILPMKIARSSSVFLLWNANARARSSAPIGFLLRRRDSADAETRSGGESIESTWAAVRRTNTTYRRS